MIEASIDPEREECVIGDEGGIFHVSVLCDRSAEQPYLVAMCDFFDSIDATVERVTAPMEFPERRWMVDQETKGPITCLRCLGS